MGSTHWAIRWWVSLSFHFTWKADRYARMMLDDRSRPIAKGYTHDRCELSCQYANLESHQGSARSSLSSVYRPCSLGCLAFAGRDDRKGARVRRPSRRGISDVTVLSLIRSG